MKIDITDDQRFDRECDFMQERGFTLCDALEEFHLETRWVPPHNFTKKEQEDIEQGVKEIAWYPYPIAWDSRICRPKIFKKESEHE